MDKINPIDWLSQNISTTFDQFKLAFSGYDVTKLKKMYDDFKNNSSSISGGNLSKILETSVAAVGSITLLKGLVGNLSSAINSFDSNAGFPQLNDELSSISIKSKNFGGILNDIANSAAKTILINFQQQSALLGLINKKIGLTGQFSKDFREEITKASPEFIRMGISFGELAEYSGELVENSGKFLTQNSQSLIRSAEVASLYVGTLTDMAKLYPEFAKIGLGMDDTTEKISKAGKESLTLGLRSHNVTKGISENIGKLNQYGFKNGVDGLTRMVQRSIEFRTNLNAAFSVAEKTMDLTDSFNLSAELTALGGSIGDFMDPFKLSYMAVNDVGGLQDALLDMSRGLAVYNEETKKFEITGTNLRIAREYAQKLGMDMDNLTNAAIAGAEREKVRNELLAQGLNLSKEQEEFVTNMSQMKDGKMVISINSDELQNHFGRSEVAISELNSSLVNELLKYQEQIKEVSEKDMVRDQTTNLNILRRDVGAILQHMRIKTGRVIERTAEVGIKEIKGFDKKKTIKQNSKDITTKLGGDIEKVFNNGMDNISNIEKFLPEEYKKEFKKFKNEIKRKEERFEGKNYNPMEQQDIVYRGVKQALMDVESLSLKKNSGGKIAVSTYIEQNDRGLMTTDTVRKT